jgi:radical SAM superfamily enzyme YgiQ (UPF0313 family)
MAPSRKNPSILLVNPWIHDFSAYDLWMKPLGLLYLGSILRLYGIEVSLLDLVDLSFLADEERALLRKPKRKIFGQGHFYKEVIPKPEPLRRIPRNYRRYGIPPEWARRRLSFLKRPDLILMTSTMTYWYPGVFETIRFLKRHIPGVPVFLGGIYATLCRTHAEKYSEADCVLPGALHEGMMKSLLNFLGEDGSPAFPDFPSWPHPAFELYPELSYVCLLTRWGCPFSCTYCASPRLMPDWKSRSPEGVVEEILHWEKTRGICNFAFYDDALLHEAPGHLLPILKSILKRGIQLNFHAPNALHIRWIDEEVADLLFQGGFRTIRLGLETTHEGWQIESGGKVTNAEFQAAIRNLKRAGYGGHDLGVYLMVGLPGQRVEEVQESVAYVREAGARPILVEYSPIPGTPLFETAKRISPFDLENEPLFHNNSLLPCQWEGFRLEDYRRLKAELQEIDRAGGG